jgi:hypothetical protein
MKDLEDEVRSLRMMLTLMGSAMADLLAWAREVEKTGAVPVGTFDRAQKVVELRNLQDELVVCKEALEKLDGQNASTLQLHLRNRVHRLRSDMLALISDLESHDGT